jgi:nucleoside-diphosphate-sugar epimerase
MLFDGKYFDYVIHTAVVGGSRLGAEDAAVLKQNLEMYSNIMRNKSHFGKFISFGSGAELRWPTTPYGHSKQIIAESMSSKDYCINIRIFAVFDENELATRFIKSNILRYLNKEDMIIHSNMYMDFFYMKDLVRLVDYFLQTETWPYRTIDCRYLATHTLTEIAAMINYHDNYRVGIQVQDTVFQSAYSGSYIGLPIETIGLEKGIKEVYSLIKSQL